MNQHALLLSYKNIFYMTGIKDRKHTLVQMINDRETVKYFFIALNNQIVFIKILQQIAVRDEHT